ncbi:hypothetical protein MAR_026717 [Mya arenaria]|uniref:Uncharacterized protein n=1 Tax=Mya arenaria TaxID=6604 RepID=A0ABY7EUC0_MYAAR|nr:hypothetical protein MAR_026717 [Mya arenaria]
MVKTRMQRSLLE